MLIRFTLTASRTDETQKGAMNVLSREVTEGKGAAVSKTPIFLSPSEMKPLG